MVSHSAIFQSVIRVSINSIDGTSASVAASTSSSVQLGARQVGGQDETHLDLDPRIQIRGPP